MGLPNPSRETKFSGVNADREIFILPVQLTHEQAWQPYPADSYSCCMCDHTYIHKYHIHRRASLGTEEICIYIYD